MRHDKFSAGACRLEAAGGEQVGHALLDVDQRRVAGVAGHTARHRYPGSPKARSKAASSAEPETP